MKKRKSLNKRIQRLKTRLEKDAKKLAKLTMKLAAGVTAAGTRRRRKPTTSATKTKKPAKSSTQAAAKKPIPGPKARKKLNLTPERRAQLAAAMKARWAAKRAAAAANKRRNSGGQDFPPTDGSQAQ
jgi:hypothetical protein